MYVKVDYPIAICACCGVEFKPKSKRSRHCSKLCRARDLTGAIPLGQHLAKVRAAAVSRKECVCLNCGKTFLAKAGGVALKSGADSWGKYCSVDCKASATRKEVYPFSKVGFSKCRCCGKWFKGKSLVCSDACRQHQELKSRRKRQDSKRISDRTTTCLSCGVVFSRLYGNKCKTCSDKCAHKLELKAKAESGKNHRKRARFYGVDYEPFKPIEIFNRDKWKCQACGVKTPRKNKGTFKGNAPELDHIIPLSKGGGHLRSNTQLLCRSCNTAKGNGSLNDQLRLF